METSTTSATTTSVGLRYGILTGLVSIIISFLLNVSHLEQSPAKWLSLLVLVGGTVLAMRFFRQANAGFMNYGQGMGVGMTLSAAAAALSAVFSYVYLTFIDPDMVARILDKTRADMEARGNVSEDQIEQALHWTGMFMKGPALIGTALLFGLLSGLLVSLVVAAILKNSKPEFE